MYEIIIINAQNGRDVLQYQDKLKWETHRENAEDAVQDGKAFIVADEFTRSIAYAPGQAIAVLAWDLKQAIRGNVKEQITILAAQGAAQMEASPPGAVTPPPNRHTRRKTGKGK